MTGKRITYTDDEVKPIAYEIFLPGGDDAIMVDNGIFFSTLFKLERMSQREAFLWMVSEGVEKNDALDGFRWVTEISIKGMSISCGWDRRRTKKFLGKLEQAGKLRRVVHIGEHISSTRSEYFLSERVNLSETDRYKRNNIPKEICNFVIDRDGLRCSYCGSTDGPFELDHVIPWSRGGHDSADNLVVSCRHCNRIKRDRTPQEMGWKL